MFDMRKNGSFLRSFRKTNDYTGIRKKLWESDQIGIMKYTRRSVNSAEGLSNVEADDELIKVPLAISMINEEQSSEEEDQVKDDKILHN